MYYKYEGQNYAINLDDQDGLLHCYDLDLSAETTEEVKKLIREKMHIDKKEEKKRIKVLVWEGQNYRRNPTRYFEGTTNGEYSYSGYLVVWKEDGKSRRAKLSSYDIILDTEDNRVLMEKMIEIHKRVADLDEMRDSLNDQIKHIQK